MLRFNQCLLVVSLQTYWDLKGTKVSRHVRVACWAAVQGWGTSLCWFGNILGGCRNDVNTSSSSSGSSGTNEQLPIRELIADLIFDPEKGLGLQICRYNIGGSGWQTIDVGNFRYGANVARWVA